MAKKRMFNLDVLDTDAFLDMPLSAQALYFWLSMRADDDGFIGNPKRIKDYIGASDDDLKLLLAKRFLIVFEDGVIVIKHWRMHNSIQSDRYHPTNYQEDYQKLGIKENKAYTLDVSKMDTKCIQNVSRDIDIDLDIDKELDKDIDSDNNRAKSKRFVPPTIDEVKDYCFERGNDIDAESFIDFYESKGWMVGKNKMKDWKAAIRTWEKGRNSQPKRRSNGGGYDWDNL